MFKIIESIKDEPVKFLLYSDVIVEPGSIISLIDGVYADLCTGKSPFGVVSDYPDERNMVPVWYDAMLFETDIFDHSKSYEEGDLLYVDNAGQITNQKLYNDESYLVGFVSHVMENKHLEINWI